MAEFFENYPGDLGDYERETQHQKNEEKAGKDNSSIKMFQFTKSLAGNLEGKDILEIGLTKSESFPFFLEENVKSYHEINFKENSFSQSDKSKIDLNTKPYITQAKELEQKDAYDVIIMNKVLEHIPVFDMDEVWNKIKKGLRPGGFIIIRTQLFENPNASDHTSEIYEIQGMPCHKQTKETLIRLCMEQDFILAKLEQNTIGLVCKEDLLLFSEEMKDKVISTQQNELTSLGIEQTAFQKKALRKMVPNFGRLVVGCVTENNSKYFERTLRLVQSIRWFGGRLAGVNIIVCFVDKANLSYVEELEKWGVFVRIVPRFCHEHPPSNKLRLFELPEIKAYDTVMFLDCDTVIVQDPSPYIDGEHFQAKIANGSSVPHKVFVELFEHYELPIPNQYYKTSNKDEQTIWYCNTGVLIFPQSILQSFFPVWKEITEDLSNKSYLMNHSFGFCEQASLTLAFIKNPIPYKQLNNQMNCPTGIITIDPVIIHYRNAVTKKGFLKIKKSNLKSLVNHRIRKFNQRLRKYRKME